jgi:hypothetical protein
MSNGLTPEDARFVEFAEKTLDEAKRRGVPPPSRRFVEKCSIESGATSVEDGRAQTSGRTGSRFREIFAQLLKRLLASKEKIR